MDQRQLKWDKRFLVLAAHIATWSKDPSTQVGAVLVDPITNLVVGLGYNGFPRGVKDTQERLNTRELKYKLVVHAEVNAILMAGERAKGARLYTYPSFMLPPICNECCKVAIQAGVSEIVGFVVDETDERALRWRDSILLSREMCNEAGIIYRGIPLEGQQMTIPELEVLMSEFYDRIMHLAFWKEGKCEEALAEMNWIFQEVENKPEGLHNNMIAINNEFQIRKEFYEEGVRSGQIK